MIVDCMYTSVNIYVKNMDMQVKWQNRQKNAACSPNDSKPYDAKKAVTDLSVSEWAEEQKNKINGTAEADNETSENGEEQEDTALKSITDKLSRGEKLTATEKQYLLSKDPKRYKEAMDAEFEQSSYEQMLKRCRTRDEFHKTRTMRVLSALGSLNSAKNNPNISPENKMEAVAAIQRSLKAASKIEADFVRRGEYSSLPTQAEQIAAAKLLAKARRSRCESKKEQEEKKKIKKKKSVTWKNGKKVVKKEKVKKKYRIKKRKITMAEAENSYVVQKVKKAYKRGGTGIYAAAIMGSSDSKVFDVKV